MNRAASIRFGLVLFDLDGTLCRSEEDIILAWQETLDTLGLSCPRFRSLFRVGPSLQEMTDILFPGISRERKEEIIREFKFRYDNSPFPGTVPYEWADAMLAALKHAGRKLAVVTNKRQGPTRFLLKKFGWETQFDGSKTRGWMVRTARYKYVLYDKGRHREQLFDMQNDRGETRNLMMENAYTKVAQEHRDILEKFMNSHKIRPTRPKLHDVPGKVLTKATKH